MNHDEYQLCVILIVAGVILALALIDAYNKDKP
jgi:hypothetical protein